MKSLCFYPRRTFFHCFLVNLFELILVTGLCLSVQAQELIWAKRAGGINYDEARGVAALADGSSLISGVFSNTATFGPGEAGQRNLTSAGGSDIFIARYNADGTLAWAKRAGGGNADGAVSMSALPDNSALAVGYFTGKATFGPGEVGQTILTAAGANDAFIARYHADGTLAWAKRAGGSNGDVAGHVSVLPDGGALVVGVFWDTATFGPGEAGQTILTSAGGMDIFVAHYNADGTLAWAKQAGGSGETDMMADPVFVSALPDGSALVTGGFFGTAIFGPGEPGEIILTGGGPFVARYNPDGTLDWAKQVGGDYHSGIVTLTDGGALVTGNFQGTATFGTGEPGETTLTSGGNYDIFVARYNVDGTLAWAKRAGGFGQDGPSGIAVLSDNSSLVAGRFYIRATFGPGEAGETILSSTGRVQIFIAHYNADGSLAWASQAGGDGDDAALGVAALPVVGSAVVTGYFSGTASFGSGELGQTILTSAGSYDIFIAKYANPSTLTSVGTDWRLYR